ncbi:MAG: YbhB/YbcL family Raf kinase inhibitor-like protein [Rhodoferax sp.]
MTLILSSASFAHEGPIPQRYTCDGDDVSPPLRWSGVPANAKSLTLIVDDPDAPDPRAPTMVWVHWVLYNIPPQTAGLAAGMQAPLLPQGTLQGYNDWHSTGYAGPCPPMGKHRYFFRVFALDAVLPELDKADKGALEKAMRGHVLAQAELMGWYQRPQ